MNAYEIADELDTHYGNPLGPKQYDIIKAAIDMLRQQQAEIEALKAEKEKLFMGMLDMALDAEMKDLKNGN
jgi:hypothetical protein